MSLAHDVRDQSDIFWCKRMDTPVWPLFVSNWKSSATKACEGSNDMCLCRWVNAQYSTSKTSTSLSNEETETPTPSPAIQGRRMRYLQSNRSKNACTDYKHDWLDEFSRICKLLQKKKKKNLPFFFFYFVRRFFLIKKSKTFKWSCSKDAMHNTYAYAHTYGPTMKGKEKKKKES